MNIYFRQPEIIFENILNLIQNRAEEFFLQINLIHVAELR